MSKKDDEINRQLIFNSGGANPEDYLTPKQLQRYLDNPDKFIDIDVDLAMNQEKDEEKDYERNRRENRPDLKPTNFVERFKKNELGKESVDNMITGLTNDWNQLSPKTRNLITTSAKFLADSYQDVRTISEEEKRTYDPIKKVNAYAGAGAARLFEAGGDLIDFTFGNVGRGIANVAGLDPRLGEVAAIGTSIYGTAKAPKALQAFSKTQMARNMAMDAGMTMGAQYQFGKETVKTVKKGFKNIKKGYTENFSKDASQRVVNVVGEAIDSDSASFRDVYSLAQSINRKTDIGMQKSIKEAKLLIGIRNKGLLAEGTTKGSGSINQALARLQKIKKDRNIDPRISNVTNPSLLIGNILNVGDKGFSYGKGINKLTAPEFIDQRFQSYGFKKGPNGGWFLDRETYNKLPSNQQREIIQIMQTAVDQTVPLSFTKDKIKKNLELNQDLAEYNAKYGARAELHHSFPSALSAEFFLDKEYMGPEWKELIRIANDEFNNYPGQPFGVDENSNLVAVPSKIGTNHPNYDAVVARYGKVPPHLHNIIHSQFFANETGMSGKKFFNQDRLAKMDEGFEGELEVWREWNAIIKRNREMWEEALAQLDVFFSKASLSENPEKLTELLEQYLSKGKITVGQGLVRDKDGNVILSKKGTDTALGRMETATYAQFPVNDIVRTALADFKKDADLLFSNDPRLADIVNKVAEVPGLTEAEKELLEDLLLKITHYNSIVVTDGRRRAYIVTGISASKNKANIKKYNDLRQLKIPNLQISDVDIKSRVFPDIKLPTKLKQMELILDEQLELDL